MVGLPSLQLLSNSNKLHIYIYIHILYVCIPLYKHTHTLTVHIYTFLCKRSRCCCVRVLALHVQGPEFDLSTASGKRFLFTTLFFSPQSSGALAAS